MIKVLTPQVDRTVSITLVGSGIVATGLASELNTRFQDVAVITNIRDAIDGVGDRTDNDVVITLATHFDDTTSVIGELAATHPRLLTVLVEASAQLAIPLLRSGIAGCVLLADGIDAIADAVRSTANGDAPLSPVVARWLIDAWNAESPTNSDLTDRELEVLGLVTDGLSNKQIARRLGISERTVKAHLTRVFQRIGASSRVEAALWMSRNNNVRGRHARQSSPITSSANSAWRNDSMQRRRVGPTLPNAMPRSAAVVA